LLYAEAPPGDEASGIQNLKNRGPPSAARMDRRRLLKTSLLVAEVALVLAVAWFMWDVRMASFPALFLDNGGSYYIGTDPYYHLREALYSAEHFPASLRFDPYTNYPAGTGTGQFGTLFDLGAAALAIVAAGFRTPDRHTVELVVGWYPALLGALIAIPTYLVARRIMGRVAAAFAILLLALFPGEFLIRSLAGYADHHVAEALFSTLAVLGWLVAHAAAERHRADLRALARDPRTLAKPTGAALLGGVALALYFHVWPPAVLFVAILGLAIAIQAAIHHHRGETLAPLAFASTVFFATAFVLTAPLTEATTSFAPSAYSLLQPTFLLLAAVAGPALWFLSEALRARDAPKPAFPAGVAALALLPVVAAMVLSPTQLWPVLKWSLGWVTPFGATDRTLTIAEAQPTCPGEIWLDCAGMASSYGLFILIATLGAVMLVGRVIRAPRHADIVLLVWSLTTFFAVTAQVRFQYYFAITVALLSAYFLHAALELTGFNAALERAIHGNPAHEEAKRGQGRRTRTATKSAEALTAARALPIAVAILLVLPGNILLNKDSDGRLADHCGSRVQYRPSYAIGHCIGVDGDVQVWTRALAWMRDHTADPGVSLYTKPEGNHPGDYGVISWWDYGHWTQLIAERPPVTNNFQQGAPLASLVFTSPNEREANERLDAWTDRHGANRVRYLLVSDEDVGGKYNPITVWADRGLERGTRAYTIDGIPSPQQLPLIDRTTFLQKLYLEDGRDYHTWRLVYEYPRLSQIHTFLNVQTNGFGSLSQDAGPLLGNLTPTPSHDPDWISVQRGSNGQPAFAVYDRWFAAKLKIYERVEGARLHGLADPGETITAAIPLVARQEPGEARAFTWMASTTAGPDGTWNLTVPYASHDPVPAEDGGTDTRVHATDHYTLWTGTADNPRLVATPIPVSDRDTRDGNAIRVDFV